MLKKELFSNAIGSNIRVNCSLTPIVFGVNCSLTPIVFVVPRVSVLILKLLM